jgi:hypothetical protein
MTKDNRNQTSKTPPVDSAGSRSDTSHEAPRPYFGIQEPEFTEGGGFGRHRQTSAGQSQEGSRNPSGKTVVPPPDNRPANEKAKRGSET